MGATASGAERTSNDVPCGAAALLAFGNLIPADLANWELKEMEVPRAGTTERPEMKYILLHKTCGFEWKTVEGVLSDRLVCYSCGKK